MKKIHSKVLLAQLQANVRELILQASQLQQTDTATLHIVPAPGKWSVAQVLEHQNIYSRYYLQAIEKKLHFNESTPHPLYTPGWLGNYFTNLMKPTADKRIVKRMQSPKNALPSVQPDAVIMLKEFLQHQHHLLNLLHIAGTVNLESIRIPTSLSKLIQLKLGDTFRFFIAHEQRHFVQIQNVLHLVERSVKVEEVFA